MTTTTPTFDALTADGRSALADMDGASPGGGLVTSQPASGPQITPGDIVRYCGAWMAVTEAGHNGILGLTRLALIGAAGAVTAHTMLASDVIDRRTDARIDPQTLYKLADRAAAYRYISTAPGATDGAVDDEQLAAWIEEKHRTSLDEGTITSLHDVARLARVAVEVLDEHSATHPIRDITVWTLDGGSGEALVTVDHPAAGRLASFTVRPQSLSGRTYREALTELLAIARALTGRLDALVASTAHLWTQPTRDTPRQDRADRTADAKRILFDRLLAAIPPGLRDRAEDWLTDLLYLAEGDLTRDGQEEVIREALGEADPDPSPTRDYEVAADETRTVRARSPEEAVALVLREAAEEADDRHHEPDPNPLFYVRLAHSRGPWQLVNEHEAPALPAACDQDGPLHGPQGRKAVATWTCPGCGTPYPQNGPDLITGHVSQCDYVDGSGQEYDLTLKWSVTHWHIATVRSSDLAAATGARPFAELTGRVIAARGTDVELPTYLDELGGRCDPEPDGRQISALYDARQDQPRRAGTGQER